MGHVNPLDFFSEDAYNDAVHEEAQGPCSIAEADQHYANEVGKENPEQCWILSDRDVWYRNPSYRGPVTRHPEDDYND